jgi:protein phosphatase PTC7
MSTPKVQASKRPLTTTLASSFFSLVKTVLTLALLSLLLLYTLSKYFGVSFSLQGQHQFTPASFDFDQWFEAEEDVSESVVVPVAGQVRPRTTRVVVQGADDQIPVMDDITVPAPSAPAMDDITVTVAVPPSATPTAPAWEEQVAPCSATFETVAVPAATTTTPTAPAAWEWQGYPTLDQTMPVPSAPPMEEDADLAIQPAVQPPKPDGDCEVKNNDGKKVAVVDGKKPVESVGQVFKAMAGRFREFVKRSFDRVKKPVASSADSTTTAAATTSTTTTAAPLSQPVPPPTANTLHYYTRCIPKTADHKSRCGEDSITAFKTQGSAYVLAVADGVGGWSRHGVDPSLFSTQLIASIEQHASSNPALGCAGQLLDEAFQNMVDLNTAGTVRTPGSSTACVAVIDATTKSMSVCNVGDSGLLVVRSGQVAFKTTPLQTSFNSPLQLVINPRTGAVSNPVSRGQNATFQLQQGDLLIMASDGLFDNLTNEFILNYLQQSQTSTLDSISKDLVEAAKFISGRKDVDTPFAMEARKAGRVNAIGGKPDDISIVLAMVA